MEHFGDNSFRCLDQLQVIRLNLPRWRSHNFNTNTFAGLSNVTVLDLSGCVELCSPTLITILSDSFQMPKLSELVFVGTCLTCGYYNYLELNQTFSNLIGTRNITSINVSSSKISCDDVNSETACTS